MTQPVTELDPRFSSPDAAATEWKVAVDALERAEVYWLSTVRPDGRPHVTPLIAVWHDAVLCFTTGPYERKAKNLAGNRHCVVTTGSSSLTEGLDLVVEGDAVRVTDDATLQHLVDAFASKYGTDTWHFTVRDGAFHNEAGGRALVFRIEPRTVFGFGRGETYSQTAWRFQRSSHGFS
jgi:nitroimidazol reductase NimA-like FMN-containing flavoprotein (pyridoxamine 5'-phosphate oxidase superfamily)